MLESSEERVCKQCGKTFRFAYYNAEDYVYRRGNKIFCGYKCVREFDKAVEAKKAARKEKHGKEKIKGG